MVNLIYWPDVIVTIILGLLTAFGFLFELAGETVPGWHTISWWAHRDKRIRRTILGAVALLFVILLFHFATNIGR